MNKQNIRLFFIVSIFVTGMMVFSTWQQEHASAPEGVAAALANDVPINYQASNIPAVAAQPTFSQQVSEKLIEINTDNFIAKVDPVGGDLVYLELKNYPVELSTPDEGFVLLDTSQERMFVAQSGLLSEYGPDSQSKGRGVYSYKSADIKMNADKTVLNVDLNFTTENNVEITKRYIFNRDSYTVLMHYIIENKGTDNYIASLYGRLKRKDHGNKGAGPLGSVRSYTGAAVTTPDTKYKKISFGDMQKKTFKQTITGGWAAMVEHYFTVAWVPSAESKNTYQSESFGDDVYGIRYVGTPFSVAPSESLTIESKLYAGPEVAEDLKNLSSGLELTVDYGVLWFLCQPIFWVLKTCYEFVGNWGVAIILTTVIIKALFYKLSASSYRSMGNMRKVQPKITALKERCGEDKQKFAQEMMALYKREKINPLGGCLPILVQIPVFIALYYVLLESVELRQAPFVFWLNDLSSKDPYYVLPLIMGASMFVQQKLNPTPPDPIQAKVMMFMPLFFTFIFLQFPAGLVLYWTVNNLLSILQQWSITRRIEMAGK